jgi:tRNA-specific 2-thiouridylase
VLKFDLLLRRAEALGATKLATGHYARTAAGRLYAATDPAKDQSYFLFPVRPEALARVEFPLGGLTKPEVRAHAERMGLVTAHKPESMEVCFVPDDDHARFVGAWARERDPLFDGAGEIVDEEGNVLGHHAGYYRYTVGQRRGIGVAAPEALYVLRVEPDTRRVVVGSDDALLAWGLTARGANWFRPPGEGTFARIRHRGAFIPCTVELGGGAAGEVRVQFRAPARAVSPGQAIVFYEGDEVVGGAWIRRAHAA